MSGLGFFFKPPYFGIDIDNAEGEVERFKSGDIEENIIYEFIESMISKRREEIMQELVILKNKKRHERRQA
ncbi:hypothetical protein EfmAA96_19680 [Enterococcus faecium]|nr:hypothetical protein EfmAA96_19680 [Enterococcus faecium]